MNTQVMTPYHPPHCPQYWVHPQLQLHFPITLQLFLPTKILHNIQIYISITLPHFPIYCPILSPVLPYLSYHCNHLVKPHLTLQVPDQQTFICTTLCYPQYCLQENPHIQTKCRTTYTIIHVCLFSPL